MDTINVVRINQSEIKESSVLLGKAFATQPSSIALYSGETEVVIANRLKYVFQAMLQHLPGDIFVAKDNGSIVGAMRIVEWPGCQPSPAQRIRMLPLLFRGGGGIGTLRRSMEFRGTWAKSDPQKPHYHLDPLGVLPEKQGLGVGSKLMEYYCNILDMSHKAAYHETDRTKNVDFYQRFGFKVIGEETILGFQNWYMWREAIPNS